MEALWTVLNTLDQAATPKIEGTLLALAFISGLVSWTPAFIVLMTAYVLGAGTIPRLLGPMANKRDAG